LPAATTALDSLLFRDAFGMPEMRDVFSGRSTIARYIDVEIALARAADAAITGHIDRERSAGSPARPTTSAIP